jgi:hypothetical protein
MQTPAGQAKTRSRRMLTELWQSDPFTERKETLIDTVDTDYHWSKGDIITVSRGDHGRFRVIHTEVDIADAGLRREILMMKL